MNGESVQGPMRPSLTPDIGVVMFWDSMRLRYANDEARSYMARAGSMDAVLSRKEDLQLAIVKLGVHVRNRRTAEMDALPSGVLATQVVSTQQGRFRLHALDVPDRNREAGQQIMIVIEDCRKERPLSIRTPAS